MPTFPPSDAALVDGLVLGRVDMEFMPDAIQDRHADGEAEAENPCKIPHPINPLQQSVIVRVEADLFSRHPPEHHAIHPGGIGEDERQKDHRDDQHDEQREVAR